MAIKKKRFSGMARYVASVLVLLSAIAITAVMANSSKKTEDAERDSFTQTVDVFEAKQFSGMLEIDVSGIVESHREVDLASQVSGTVTKRAPECQAGTFVEEGTTLVWIDTTNYDLAVKRFEAEKKQAEANIRELDEELEGMTKSIKLAQKDYDLQRKETERRLAAGNALSKTELDQARRALTAAERTLTELNNAQRLAKTRRARLSTGIDLSEVRLNEARVNIERCQIKAPFSGVVVNDMVEVGDYVTAGKNVVIFEDTSKVDVKCNLREDQLARIIRYQMTDSRAQTDPRMAYQLPPTPVKILLKEDRSEVEWSGMLARFDGLGLDSQTKTIPVLVEVSNPIAKVKGRASSVPKALIKGMFVSVLIELNAAEFEDEVLLQLPAIAVRPGNYVWSVIDGKLKRHQIEVIDRQNEDAPDPRDRMVVVRADPTELNSRSKIVTTPLSQPLPGSTVKILNETNADSETDENGDPKSESKMDSDANTSKSPQNGTTPTSVESDQLSAPRTTSKKESNRS